MRGEMKYMLNCILIKKAVVTKALLRSSGSSVHSIAFCRSLCEERSIRIR